MCLLCPELRRSSESPGAMPNRKCRLSLLKERRHNSPPGGCNHSAFFSTSVFIGHIMPPFLPLQNIYLQFDHLLKNRQCNHGIVQNAPLNAISVRNLSSNEPLIHLQELFKPGSLMKETFSSRFRVILPTTRLVCSCKSRSVVESLSRA